MSDDPRNPDLEAAILEQPDDAEAYRVLADWLEGQGHVRAQLIRLQMEPRSKPTKPERALFNKHHHELIGPLSKAKHVIWQYGFVREVLIDNAGLPALDHPSCRFLSTLRAAVTTDKALPLATQLPRTLRQFALYEETQPATQPPSSFEPLWSTIDQLPHLTCFELSGWFDLDTATLPRTSVLKLRWDQRDVTSTLERLLERRPPLRELALEGRASPSSVIALIAQSELVELRLRTTRVDDVITALCALPAAASIRLLDLGRSDVGPDGIEALIAARPELRALQVVDLQNCQLEEDLYDQLEAVGLAVVSDRYDDAGE